MATLNYQKQNGIPCYNLCSQKTNYIFIIITSMTFSWSYEGRVYRTQGVMGSKDRSLLAMSYDFVLGNAYGGSSLGDEERLTSARIARYRGKEM
jgi:hypothetical protein